MKTDQEQQTPASKTTTARPIIFTVQTNEEAKPRGFFGRLLGKKVETSRTFTIYPPKLGKLQILSRYLLHLGLDDAALKENPYAETLRACAEKPDVVYELMAAAVCNTKEELLDEVHRRELANFFKWHGDAKDFGALVLAILTQNNYASFIKSVGLLKYFRINKPAAVDEAPGKDSNPVEQGDKK